jgi:catechol 2,3-dioxygenase-like lactoylglutathione lyase family enzyme
MAEEEPVPRFLAPMLVAADFRATVAFYRTVLGLPVQGESPYGECRTGTSLLSILDGNFIGRTGELDRPMAGSLTPSGQTVLAIEVGDLEETFERLVATGVQFLSPPSDRLPLGRKYAFLRDPDGRTVGLLGPRTT